MIDGWRIGADTGGTFTDVVMADADGQLRFVKVPSSPPAFDEAVVAGVHDLTAGAVDVASVIEVIHGTTVATNAVLERQGARTALVTTAGFRDVLELRRMRMPDVYDYFWMKPAPLIERRLRFEIDERLAADGTVLVPLSEDAAREVAHKLDRANVEAVAVCLLHSYLHPAHERRLGEILRRELPNILISLSCEVVRERDEYERTATTAVNAYVRPLMQSYLGALKNGLRDAGVRAPVRIMRSSGGVMTLSDCAVRPVHALESGPAAGVVAAQGLAASLHCADVIAFDMGGTTAKASLIEGGQVSRSLEYEVGGSVSMSSRLLRGGGELIRIPTLDIAEIGAGGGSVAWLDRAQGLHVGPRSSGATPGPACYGLGGINPTVTDADVALGYIREGRLGAGHLSVSSELAERALRRLADPLKMSNVELARGIHAVANSTMMRALRAVSSERGRDPRECTLIAYGGSGPIHAAPLAAELGITTVVVPPLAGLFSAVGLLLARSEFHDVAYCRIDARHPDIQQLRDLDREVRVRIARDADTDQPLEWRRVAELRYRGQNWNVPVPFPGEIGDASVAQLVQCFEQEYERLYGTRLEPGSSVEIRGIRVLASGPSHELFESASISGESYCVTGSRVADFGPSHGGIETEVVLRGDIGPNRVSGPLLIDEYDTSVVVPPGWTVETRGPGALILTDTTSQMSRARSTASVDKYGTRSPADSAVRGVEDTPVGRRAKAYKSAPAIRAGVSAIDRELVANALSTIADEMATTILRTAHSTVVRDAMDFSAALCGPSGEIVGQAVTIPVHIGSIPHAMTSLLALWRGRFRPGDVYVVNDPFDGASHTPDIFVVKPVFLGKQLMGFAVNVAHHADVGGRVLGTVATGNRTIFEEGLRLPWTRLCADDKPVEEIWRIIRANVRMPATTTGDLNAQIAACMIGERGMRAMTRRYGVGVLIQQMDELVDHTERLLRAEIRDWPDGSATYTDYLDSDGITERPVAITVRLTIEGSTLTADFSGSAPMVQGALNCTHSFTAATVYHAVLSACANDIPRTGGVTRPITVITEPGTVTDVALPGASSMRGITGYRVSDAFNGALAQLVPQRVSAAGEGGSTMAYFTGRHDAEQFVYSEIVVGTRGGRPTADGSDGLANPCGGIANVPIEVAEAEWPVRIERYGFVPDSGGAGRYRGGLAVERMWRALAADTSLEVRSDRQVHKPYGLSGGHEGAASANAIIRASGQRTRLPAMFSATLQSDDTFYHRMAGGGGWGDPLERELDAVARDVVDGRVTTRAACACYGVVVDSDGSIDYEATEATRATMRRKTGLPNLPIGPAPDQIPS
jgi:5-oxoprolinase (ATP-hydrolysing)/N-methylhydantoinase A